ncbi:MAG: DUF2127 domain-containing protein [Psychromonas sp.]|nr:DUF2127 domain-containing protein [Psychromonas sp.]
MTTTKTGLKAIAALEASKGVIAILVAFGLHVLAGKNLQHVAELIVSYAHLNPASHFPSIFIHAASTFSDSKTNLLAIGAFAYSLIRLVEAYGLWNELVWTEWFALLSGAIYLPFEIYEVIFHTGFLAVGALLINIIVVWYMSRILLSKREEEKQC